jgi:Protein of unknown function (DUF2950)
MRWQSKFTSAAVLIISLVLFAVIALAQEPGQKTFANPQDAGQALYEAGKSGDKAAMEAVLGASSASMLSSGDEVEDKNNRDLFIQRYEQMHRWAKEINGNQTLIIGPENWPFPVPLKSAGNTWYFDSKAGVKEVLFRRIGKNELAAIRTCHVLADAQDEYFSQKQQYAQHVVSEPGQQNGLYWKAAEGEPESPIGPLVAFATARGYGGQHDTPQPFYGYYFHTLTAQGANVKGGAKSYIVDGKMTGGFAYLAWPAEYRNSGVMTFLVGPDGTVYEKDLGPKTADLAKAINAYNPDKTWKIAWTDDDSQ